MNRLLVLLLATASMAASGCLGTPDDFVATIDWVAHDPETGEVLAQGSGLTFVTGRDASGLGRELEDSVRDHRAGDNYTVVVDDLDIDQEVRIPRLLGSDPAVGEIPVAAFQQQFGRLPEPNETFEFNAFYNARVVSVGAQNFTYRFVLDGDEQRIEVRAVGAELVSTIEPVEVEQEDGTVVEEEHLVRRLAPIVGARFTINPPTPQNPQTPLGLAPGTYVTVGAEGDDFVLQRSSAFDPALVEREVRFRVTVHSVERITEDQAGLEEGRYGARGGSPYVNGDPTKVEVGHHHDEDDHVEDAHGDAPADDGHDDHTH